MKRLLLIAGLLAALLGAGFWIYTARKPAPAPKAALQHLVVNEAARTLLYLPLYHAQRQGYFRSGGVEIEIVTGGTATSSMAALISGDADIAQADPMYGPISQSKGSDIVVVGQVVGRVGLWGVARPGVVRTFDAAGLRSSTIITHPRPMTAFTYTSIFLDDLKLQDAVRVIQTKPGTELATYQAEKSADFLVGVEPTISILEEQGAKVVHSWPTALGDRPFSGLMVRRSILSNRGDAIAAVLRAYQRALDDIHKGDPEVVRTARAYFPSIVPGVLDRALRRLTVEEVFPRSIAIAAPAWDAAIAARRRVGDLTGPSPYDGNVMAGFIATALKR